MSKPSTSGLAILEVMKNYTKPAEMIHIEHEVCLRWDFDKKDVQGAMLACINGAHIKLRNDWLVELPE